ncbi:unnamed protein product [Lactuca virosa]|uniref:F-box domain-containing protein n=1 Tax=Lactuca virosa TaxID=75947 RepID=A0AAU9NDW6_9ASTR|nr:unnamed protein product [Lactuca virosa]
MSDYIPSEILVEIFKRLPVKSVLQLRSVSKPWKSLIDSSEFIAAYGAHQTQLQSLLVTYKDPESEQPDETYASLVDDETFVPQEIRPTLPLLAKLLRPSRVIGSSHGLVCLSANDPYQNDHKPLGRKMAVLCNPSIRKSVGVTVHLAIDMPKSYVLGFGVCPITSDPTILKINVGVVEVFTLRTRSWRVLSYNPQINSLKFPRRQVVVGRFIYFVAYVEKEKPLIVSFDMTTHEFRTKDIPDSFARQPCPYFSISKVSEALVVLKYNTMGMGDWAVWIVDDGVPNSCTKLFTISNVPRAICLTTVLGFTDRSELLIERQDDVAGWRKSSLFVYEPCSQHIDDIGIDGIQGSFSVGYYMETLLLLDQPDSSVYVENGVGPMDFRLWINLLPDEVLVIK